MLTIETARVFEPLLKLSRYKGAFGGRGSGKSHFMAGAVVNYCLLNPGSRIVCIREVQKTLAQSAKLLIEKKIQEFGVGSEFRVLYDRIETPGGGLIIFQGMQDQNAESIKSLESYNVAWCEEAQTLYNRSLALLRPTIRAEASEIWFSSNPRRKSRRPSRTSASAKADELENGTERAVEILTSLNWGDAQARGIVSALARLPPWRGPGSWRWPLLHHLGFGTPEAGPDRAPHPVALPHRGPSQRGSGHRYSDQSSQDRGGGNESLPALCGPTGLRASARPTASSAQRSPAVTLARRP
jgi:hypothetical protein